MWKCENVLWKGENVMWKCNINVYDYIYIISCIVSCIMCMLLHPICGFIHIWRTQWFFTLFCTKSIFYSNLSTFWFKIVWRKMCVRRNGVFLGNPNSESEFYKANLIHNCKFILGHEAIQGLKYTKNQAKLPEIDVLNRN